MLEVYQLLISMYLNFIYYLNYYIYSCKSFHLEYFYCLFNLLINSLKKYLKTYIFFLTFFISL